MNRDKYATLLHFKLKRYYSCNKIFNILSRINSYSNVKIIKSFMINSIKYFLSVICSKIGVSKKGY